MSIIHKFSIRGLDILISITLSILFLPTWLYLLFKHVFTSKKQTMLIKKSVKNIKGDNFFLYHFLSKPNSRSLWLISILKGDLSFAGSKLNDQKSNLKCKPGLFNQAEINRKIGIDEIYNSIEKNQEALTITTYIKLIIKGIITDTIYTADSMREQSYFSLFGIRLDNVRMKTAIDWVLSESENTKIGFFINVNSVNIAHDDQVYKRILNMSDRNFIDGSGLRIAAKHVGFKLQDNVNGTDMLPLLCNKMQHTKDSIFLLGSNLGVAQRTASNLQKQFSNLTISGTHHGYFDDSDAEKIIDLVNASGATILLVAMGSPNQEEFILNHQHNLQCKTVLAVGGLFDFYSGDIKRAPLWLREIGFEWAYRLIQQPKSKFHRYVIGNPRFLFNTFFDKNIVQTRKS